VVITGSTNLAVIMQLLPEAGGTSCMITGSPNLAVIMQFLPEAGGTSCMITGSTNLAVIMQLLRAVHRSGSWTVVKAFTSPRLR
jgi:hypothetical protein